MVRRMLSVVVLCLIAATAAAQEQRGSIQGVVRDSTGAHVPGVTVEVRSPALVGVSSAVTDAQGLYRFPALPPGTYEVSATLQGFTPAKADNVALELGQLLSVNLTLGVAAVAETVSVKAESPLIDVKQNAATLVVPLEIIERIPKGRNFKDVMTSAPGVNDESKGGGQMIDGSSASENRWVVDGMDTTTIRTGVSNKDVRLDFIDQVQVKQSGYNAEFRAATGGVVSAVTRNGGNTYHGSIGAYYRADDLNGKVRPTLRLNPSNQSIAEYVTTKPAEFQNYEPVFSLGGPILRDRAWFFGGFVPQINDQERTVTFQQNGVTDTFKSREKQMDGNFNVSAQITRNLRGKFSSILERTRGEVGLPTIEPDGTSISNPTLFPDQNYTRSYNDLYSGVADWVVSPTMYVNVTTGLLGYGSRLEGPSGDRLRHTFTDTNQTGARFADIPEAFRKPNGYADFISSSRNDHDNYGRFNLSADATFYRSWFGQHTLKGGVQYEQLTNDVNDGAQFPTINLNWNRTRAALDGRQVTGKYGYYVVSQTRTFGTIDFSNLGFFVQDAWSVNNRLTLNLGIRAEREDIPSYVEDNPGIHFGFGDKIAPRVGFAYDVRGDNKLKAYGSWGMFYDLTKTNLPRGLFGAEHAVNYYYTLDTFDWPAIQCSHPPVSGPSCPGTFIEQVDNRHPSNARDNNLIAPDLEPVRTEELTFGLDRELNRTMSLGVRYAHKWLDQTFEDVGTLVPNVGEVFRIANPGQGIAEFPLRSECATCPAQPRPKRAYDGIEVRLRKRLANRWSMDTSYLYSRLYGNYSGLSSSDENGRNAPNTDRFFDGLYQAFDAGGNPVYGRLQTDRPHQFKVQATYDLPWGTGLGMNYVLESGTPLQTQINQKTIPFFPNGRGDLGRTPVFSRTDLAVQHDLRFRGTRVNVGVNVTNLFDQDTATNYNVTPYRDALNLTNEAFFAGFDFATAVANTAGIRPDARFRQPSTFLARREIRLSARFSF
jgi:hypothetical protein